MPLPSPKPGEEQDKWIPRCMGNDAMKEEFPDNKQRQAVCQQKWRDKDKKAADDSEIERRCFAEAELRIDAEGDDAQPVIRGHAAMFNKLSGEMIGFDDTGRLRTFREQIAPGAFARSIAKQVDVKALIGHETELQTIGRTANNTLSLEEDSKGLAVRITPPDTQPGRDVTELVRRGDLNQMSFAFKIRKGGESWEDGEKGIAIRTVSDLDLFDVSIVSFPAYPQTSVAVRSLAAWQTERDKAAQNQRELNQRLLDSRAEME